MFKRLRDILRRLLTTHAAWPILLAIAMLCSASIFALQVSSPERAQRQEQFIALGAVVVLLILIPVYEWFGHMAIAAFGVVVVLLGCVLLTDPSKGSHRWFSIGGFFQLQPSELAKIVYVLALAWYLRYRRDIRTLAGLVIPFVMTIPPAALILIEPDLGTALLFPITLYAMLIAAGARLRHLVSIVLVVLVLLPVAYNFLQPFQKNRMLDFAIRVYAVFNRDDRGADVRLARHLQGKGYHGHMAQVAVGSGGTWGLQPNAETPSVLPPEAYTDSIFCVIGARWGFAGSAVVIVLYLALLGATIEIAASTKDPFGRLTAIGLASIMIAQAFINIAMNIGLAPIVGIPLPFMSYGGSSLVTSFIAGGILLNISVRRHVKTTSLPSSFAAS